MTARDRATTLLAIAVLEARIAAEKKRLRAEFTTELVTGERVPGLIDPDDPEGTGLGFVQKRKGSTSARVTDPDALLGWALEHAPGEVVTTRAVRPAFVTRLLDAVKADGAWIDPDTGEAIDVDGVEVSTGQPTLIVKASEQADRLVAEALAGRRLALPGIGGGDQ